MFRPALIFALIMAAPLALAETASSTSPTPGTREVANDETVVTPDGESFFSPKTVDDITAMATVTPDARDLTSDLGED